MDLHEDVEWFNWKKELDKVLDEKGFYIKGQKGDPNLLTNRKKKVHEDDGVADA